MEADPHFDTKSSVEVYKSALNYMKELSPSFIIDLGDVSMSEKLHLSLESLELRY